MNHNSLKIETLLLTTTRVLTFTGARLLTSASGFFFEREERLFLVTSRHVVVDNLFNCRPSKLLRLNVIREILFE